MWKVPSPPWDIRNNKEYTTDELASQRKMKVEGASHSFLRWVAIDLSSVSQRAGLSGKKGHLAKVLPKIVRNSNRYLKKNMSGKHGGLIYLDLYPFSRHP